MTIGIKARYWTKIVEIMVDTTTTMVITHEVREHTLGMMREVITQELGTRERHAMEIMR